MNVSAHGKLHDLSAMTSIGGVPAGSTSTWSATECKFPWCLGVEQKDLPLAKRSILVGENHQCPEVPMRQRPCHRPWTLWNWSF